MTVKVTAPILLFDIEGTTSSIHFVKNVLFPYSAEKFPEYLTNNSTDPFFLLELKSIAGAIRPDGTIDVELTTRHFLDLIKQDVKDPLLKDIQGKIWRDGYEQQAYKAHVYEDVAPNWTRWHKAGRRLAIYSSGSVQAQKLFFKYSEAGDLLSLLSGHFDLAIGPKKEQSSYSKIASELGVKPKEVAFFSDVKEELVAAKASGLQAIQVRRPQTPLATFDPFILSFSEVLL